MSAAEGQTSVDVPSAPVEAQKEGKRDRLKRPVKPDNEAHKARVEELQNQMNSRRSRSEQLKQMIDQRRSYQGGPEVQEAKSKLNQINANFKGELEKKKGLREKLNALNTTRDGLRAQIRELKSKVGPLTTVQKIEERIVSLEHRITHHTVDLKEENKTREEIKKLATLKPLANGLTECQVRLNASDKERDTIMTQLKACDTKLNDIKAKEEQQRTELSQLRTKESAKSQDVPSLIKERDECREVMNALWNKMNELRDENKASNNKFYEDNKIWKEHVAEERRERDLQRDKEYQERAAERRKQAAELGGEPYHKEVDWCDQLLSHLGRYLPQSQDTVSTSEAGAQKEEGETGSAFEGMKAKKKEDNTGGFEAFLGSGVKKAKGKKGKPGSSTASIPDQKLNHSLDIVDAFGKLKVSMPMTTGQVPEAVKEVQEKREYWLKKRAEAKEKGILPGEESEGIAAKAQPQQANGIVNPGKTSKKQVANFNAEDFPDLSDFTAISAPAAPQNGNWDKNKSASDAETEKVGEETVSDKPDTKDVPTPDEPEKSERPAIHGEEATTSEQAS